MLSHCEIEASNFSVATIHTTMDKINPISDPSKGFGGLVNMGLTCYGNAVMQNLRHLPKLGWIMEQGKYNTLFKKDPSERRGKLQAVTTAFAEIVQLLGKCNKGQSVRPGTFWNRVPAAVDDTMYEQLSEKRCHDSHEFFLFLLEAIHEATIQEVDMRIVRPPPTTPEEVLVHGALKAWQDAFAKEYSPFIHMFFGMFHQKTVCQECKKTSHRWEPFNALKIPVPTEGASFNLLDSLRDDMLKEEEIQDYVCEACGPPRRLAKKSISIWRLPLTLVLTTKRFGNNGKKVGTPAEPLPLEAIDLAPYFSPESPERLGQTRYALRGIVDHHGGASFGHYTAQCKHTGNGKWHQFDDESVAELAGPRFGESTYMMFLERQ
jgi:ubiquitin C-terminal hydrolase